jgi:hypothetical protein
MVNPLSPQVAVNKEGAGLADSTDLAQFAQAILNNDPVPFVQPLRLSLAEVEARAQEIRDLRDRRRLHLLKGAKASSVPERVLGLLRRASLSPKASGFDNPQAAAQMLEQVALAGRHGLALVFLIPMGGAKAPVAVKTGRNVGPDYAEMIAAAMLDALAMAIAAIHKPGASIVIVPDAGLHTGDLGFPVEATRQHLADYMVAIDSWLGASERVVIADPLPHLPPTWVEAVRRLAAKTAIQLRSDPGHPLAALAGSLAYSINTVAYHQPFERDVLVYAAAAGHKLPGLDPQIVSDGLELNRRARMLLPHYVAVNQAIREERLLERIATAARPDAAYVRMTVHAKPGEPRPQLIEVGRFAPKPGVLPMHSLGVRGTDDVGRIHFGVTWEVTARGNRWRPVYGPGGAFMYYEPIGEVA